MADAKDIVIRYVFSIAGKGTRDFTIHIDKKTVRNNVAEEKVAPPAWTALDFEKCTNCPLNSAGNPRCPIAAALASFSEHFSTEMSFTRVDVTVNTATRDYVKQVSMQEGLRSLFGLIMATSGCPHLDFLKPMAYYHLPFSNLEETIVRSTAFYLLKQYFHARRGEPADWNLDGFERHYKEVVEVNAGIARRIRASGTLKADAQPNAIVMLDCFAQFLENEFVPDFASIESIFLGLE